LRDHGVKHISRNCPLVWWKHGGRSGRYVFRIG